MRFPSETHLITMRKLCASWKLHFDVVFAYIVEFCWYFNGFCIESISGREGLHLSGGFPRSAFRRQSVVTLNLPLNEFQSRSRLVNANRRWSSWKSAYEKPKKGYEFLDTRGDRKKFQWFKIFWENLISQVNKNTLRYMYIVCIETPKTNRDSSELWG